MLRSMQSELDSAHRRPLRAAAFVLSASALAMLVVFALLRDPLELGIVQTSAGATVGLGEPHVARAHADARRNESRHRPTPPPLVRLPGNGTHSPSVLQSQTWNRSPFANEPAARSRTEFPGELPQTTTRYYPDASSVFAIRTAHDVPVSTSGLKFTLVISHAGPTKDLEDLLGDLNVSLTVVFPWAPVGPDGHTLKYHMCGADPGSPGGVYPDFRFACPFDERQFQRGEASLYEAYKSWAPYADADLFICAFDPVFCSLLKTFNKPMLIMSAFRLDGHLMQPSAHTALLMARHVQDRMLELMHHPSVLFSCTNLYDCFYTQHFLGTRRVVPLLAVGKYALRDALNVSACVDKGVYAPRRPDAPFLFAPKKMRFTGETVIHHLGGLEAAAGVINRATAVLPAYHEMCDLGHLARGYILLPYSVHSYFVVELAAMGIPMFAPSLRLLRALEVRYHILTERTINSEGRMHGSMMNEHARSLSKTFDPNEDGDLRSLAYWLQFCDFYSYGSLVQLFDSGAELVQRALAANVTWLDAMHQDGERTALRREGVWKKNMIHALGVLGFRGHAAAARASAGGRRPAPLDFYPALTKWRRDANAPEWAPPPAAASPPSAAQPPPVPSARFVVDLEPNTTLDAANLSSVVLARALQGVRAQASVIVLGQWTVESEWFWALPFCNGTTWGRAWAWRMALEVASGPTPDLDWILDHQMRRFVRTWSREISDVARPGPKRFFDQAYELALDMRAVGLADLDFAQQVADWFRALAGVGFKQPALAASLRFVPDVAHPTKTDGLWDVRVWLG